MVGKMLKKSTKSGKFEYVQGMPYVAAAILASSKAKRLAETRKDEDGASGTSDFFPDWLVVEASMAWMEFLDDERNGRKEVFIGGDKPEESLFPLSRAVMGQSKANKALGEALNSAFSTRLVESVKSMLLETKFSDTVQLTDRQASEISTTGVSTVLRTKVFDQLTNPVQPWVNTFLMSTFGGVSSEGQSAAVLRQKTESTESLIDVITHYGAVNALLPTQIALLETVLEAEIVDFKFDQGTDSSDLDTLKERLANVTENYFTKPSGKGGAGKLITEAAKVFSTSSVKNQKNLSFNSKVIEKIHAMMTLNPPRNPNFLFLRPDMREQRLWLELKKGKEAIMTACKEI